MKQIWQSLAYNYREGGIGQPVRKIALRLRDWFWSETAWLVYRVDLSGYTREAALPLVRSELGFDSMCEQGYFKARDFEAATRARLDAGERCIGFFLGTDLVNVAWTTRGRLVLEAGLSLDDENCLGIFDCHTLPAYRSRGIYTDTLIRLLGLAREEGATVALIAVDPGNRPSIKGIERAGFLPLFRLTLLRRLGRKSLQRSVFQPTYLTAT